jgi:hypothetical protein
VEGNLIIAVRNLRRSNLLEQTVVLERYAFNIIDPDCPRATKREICYLEQCGLSLMGGTSELSSAFSTQSGHDADPEQRPGGDRSC